jgi:phosphate starvation-inducible protein PhoH and related proteins
LVKGLDQTQLKDKVIARDITLTPFDNKRLLSLCGRIDEHLRLLEQRLHVEIMVRGNVVHIVGSQKSVDTAAAIIVGLYEETEDNHELTPEQVHLYTQQVTANMETLDTPHKHKADSESITIKTPAKIINARTKNQSEYIKKVMSNPINFGIGPAGTGKTYLAVACAVAALEQKKVRRIILVRPVVEAGERLGFLPGDLAQKIDPYLRPLYDAFHEMYDFEKVARLLEQQTIEIAPLAYMRGRTLNDAFIILDESQNTTVEQMKMFLTRIGFNSTAVITGDITQVDLPRDKLSGLKHAHGILQNIPHITFSYFESKDVVRHPIVKEIIEAYERSEAKHKGE